MTAELIKLPNFELKVLKPTLKKTEEFIEVPCFSGLNLLHFALDYNLGCEEIDILILIFYLYKTRREIDGLLYFNTDDLLILRGVERNKKTKNGKAGYKKEVRKRVLKHVLNLSKLGFFRAVNYKDFNFVLDMNEKYLEDIKEFYPLSKEFFALNPVLKGWHKRTVLFLNELSQRKRASSFNIQIKKIFEILPKCCYPPFKTRDKFENMMDEITKLGLIQSWHYAKIDEDALNVKNWLYFWRMLSIKVNL